MSTDGDQIKRIAERIASRVGLSPERGISRTPVGSAVGDLSEIRAALSEINQRITQLEAHVKHGTGTVAPPECTAPTEGDAPRIRAERTVSPWLSGMYVPVNAHPSQEKFGVEEAAITELVDFLETEKKCELDPGGKPCDHCAMCSSRGF